MLKLEADEVEVISETLGISPTEARLENPLRLRLLYGYYFLLQHNPQAKPALTPETIDELFPSLLDQDGR